MSKRMTPIEKLARDICYAGFAVVRPLETKAEYWDHVSPEAKQRYIRQAEEFVYFSRKLGIDRIRSALTDCQK